MVLHSHICGGAEKHTLGLMEGLHGRGHRVAFAGPADSWLAESARRIGVECFDVQLHGFYDVCSVVKLCRAVRHFGADVLHGHLTRGAFYAGLAGRLTGRWSVATAHLMNSHKRFDWPSRIIAVSGAVRGHLVAKGYSAERIEVIHNGIAVPDGKAEDRKAIRGALGLRPDEIALCMISRLAQFKGHDLVIEALRRIADHRLRLFVVGRTEGVDWYQVLRERVDQARLQDHVRFLGHRDDVFDLLKGMDVFLSASDREAFPTSILEACAVGVPVIASRVGGTEEIIADEQTGLLFPSGDAIALSGQIARLAHDGLLRTALAQAAREQTLTRFTVDAMIDATLRLYNSAVDPRCQ